MKRVISLATAGALALVTALTVSVSAQDFNTHERTFLTFSNAVELPGMRLEPGTYVFRLADTPSRNIIQVLNEDEMEMLGQWLFIPAQRQEATGETVITFRETRADATPAVQYWYYPGETIGKEFLYPADQAMQIAQRTGATVMTEDGPVEAGAQTAGAQTEVETPTATAQAEVEAPAGGAQAEVEIAAAEPEPAPAFEARDDRPVGTSGVQQESTYAQNQYAQNELPRTASPIALSGLIALLSLAGVAGLRAFRQ